MVPTQRSITYYLRDAIVSQKTRQIEITEESVKISFEMLNTGQVDPSSCQHLFETKGKQMSAVHRKELDADIEEEKEAQQIKVIVALQVVNVKAEKGVKHKSDIADLTGTFFMPANLSDAGVLTPETNNIPWIPRNYLSPVMDDALIVGKIQNVDQYIASQTKELADIKHTGNWEKYITFVKGFWKAVNDTELFSEFIYNYVHGKQPLFLDSFVYIIPDNTISTTHHIKELYEYALTEEEPCNELYQTIIGMTPKANHTMIVNELPQMMNHAGQMKGDHPLSPSQREAVDHFAVTEDGDVLAVNGPPGTGKTTLLQAIVANMMVNRALNREDAPIIVATSTNNQAVTNIIESFVAANGSHSKNLDRHWIEGKDSFATYFPSKSKIKSAQEKAYQVTDTQMGYSVSQWETENNRNNSISRIISYCENIFGESGLSMTQCIDRLHGMLVDFDTRRQKMLKLAEKIPHEITISPYKTAENKRKMDEKILDCQQKEDTYRERLNAWEKLWKKLLLYRILGFIPKAKARLNKELSIFCDLDESELSNGSLDFSDIKAFYYDKMQENRIKYQGFQAAKKLLNIASIFESVDINVFASPKETVSLSLKSLNDLFDVNIRFYEFWLSVHYYECRWLAGERKVGEKELFKSTYPIMANKYKRLCMLTPCLVMTFFMLPANFSRYKDKYLYDFIDLLIVDEAGQVSPEIGAASFLLAKKALVVGDVHQIEPVWGVPRELDIALAIDRDVIPAGDFHILEANGLNTSESSLMKIASNACTYSKFGKKGLLLIEHRRCYDELINYCNELVYDGKLEPKRGLSTDDDKYPFIGQHTLEHIQISTNKSERKKTSRYNLAEAQKIRSWLNENYESIKKAYPNDSVNTLVGIITPFKAQADIIRSELQGLFDDIMVGTVHTFQGGERKIVLFSTVYGAEDGGAFLDFKPNLMNVAMSRAKDRFIVFGDINCLSTSRQNPSGLLRAYCERGFMK